MVEGNNQAVIGSDSIAVESLVITLLSPIVFGLATRWKYHLVFQLALGVVIFIMLFRVMANKAENPNIAIIKKSLRWSSKLLQIALVGAIATISLYISNYVTFLAPVTIFTAIACTFSLLFSLLDQILLGEYAETWVGIISEKTEDNLVGKMIRHAAYFGKGQIESVLNDKPTSPPHSNLKGLFIGIGLLSILLVVMLPIWFILGRFFGHWGTAILVVLSIVFIRDITRYIYINYGAAQSFSALEWPLGWEFLWTIAIGVLLASVFGYSLPGLM